VLATAGQTREKVFESSHISPIKNDSRENTVGWAATVSTNIRALPPFDERESLADKLSTRGGGMKEELDRLEVAEDRETTLRNNLQRLCASQRVAVVGTYGRLLGSFPKSFVEFLFPRPRSKPAGRPITPPPPPPTTTTAPAE